MQVKELANQEYEMVEKSLKGRRKRKLQTMIEKFVCSNATVIEIIPEEGEYKDLKSLASTMYTACKKSRYHVKATMIGGRVFIKKLAIDR